MTNLYLSDKVFFCVTEGQGVFLDLAQDAYSSVPIPSHLVEGGRAATEKDLSILFGPYVDELIAARLLTDEPSGGSGFFDYQSIPRPRRNIFHPHDDRAFGCSAATSEDVRTKLIDVVDFFLASQRATDLLKRQHICRIVDDVRARKASSAGVAIQPDGLRHETAIFRKLRPWYPRPYLCLYDALALIEFLARRKLFPMWVFGVQAQPFGAHCWLQAGDVLLNEGTEYAAQFTPIMTV
jgi:hypothetical protein